MSSPSAMMQIKQAITDTDSVRRMLVTITTLIVVAGLIWALGSNTLHNQQYQQVEQLIVQALRLEGRPEPFDPWRDLVPLTNPTALALAQQALAEAQRSATVDPDSITIQSQLGRAALLANQPELAIPAFSVATAQQPDSPLRWFELGLAYERLAPPLTALEPDERLWELRAPPAQQWALPVPRLPTGWWQTDEPVTRSVIVGDRLTLRGSLPITPTTLIFWMGSQTAQATTYRIRLDDQIIGEYELPATAPGWQPATLDLSKWAGQTIELHLESDHDQAGWGDVQLITADEIRCALFDCWQRARAAWQHGGYTVDQFLQAGTIAFRQQQSTDALVWYQRATLLGADTASAMWYLRYLATNSHNALAQSITIDHGWVNEELPLRAWFAWGVFLRQEQRAEQAEHAFRRSVTVPITDPASRWRLSEAYRHLGLTLWDQNRLAEALPYLAEAINLNPRNVWAHIHYGKVLYLVDPERIDEVKVSFTTALTLDSNPKTWQNLIEFWQWMKQPAEVKALCEQAHSQGIEIDKECQE